MNKLVRNVLEAFIAILCLVGIMVGSFTAAEAYRTNNGTDVIIGLAILFFSLLTVIIFMIGPSVQNFKEFYQEWSSIAKMGLDHVKKNVSQYPRVKSYVLLCLVSSFIFVCYVLLVFELGIDLDATLSPYFEFIGFIGMISAAFSALVVFLLVIQLSEEPSYIAGLPSNVPPNISARELVTRFREQFHAKVIQTDTTYNHAIQANSRIHWISGLLLLLIAILTATLHFLLPSDGTTISTMLIIGEFIIFFGLLYVAATVDESYRTQLYKTLKELKTAFHTRLKEAGLTFKVPNKKTKKNKQKQLVITESTTAGRQELLELLELAQQIKHRYGRYYTRNVDVLYILALGAFGLFALAEGSTTMYRIVGIFIVVLVLATELLILRPYLLERQLIIEANLVLAADVTRS